MKLFQVGVIVGAVVVALASMASAQSMVEGWVASVIPHCSGARPDTCDGILYVGDGVGSFGAAAEVYVPKGTMFAYGNTQIPITNVGVGDFVRINYTTATVSNVNMTVNTVSSATLLERSGAGFGPNG
jgi:hypothetical protein